jgi:hypothetical protein
MEVHDCMAALEYLSSYAPDVIVVLLHSAALGGLQILRQQWDGPLI